MTTTTPSMCFYCRHFDGETWSCVAFPAGVPGALDLAGADHRLPIAGDHGVRFAPRDRAALAVVEEVWGLEPTRYTGPLNPENPADPPETSEQRHDAAVLAELRALEPLDERPLDWTT